MKRKSNWKIIRNGRGYSEWQNQKAPEKCIAISSRKMLYKTVWDINEYTPRFRNIKDVDTKREAMKYVKDYMKSKSKSKSKIKKYPYDILP
jgi:hypothetical protein